ncbi:MAG: tetratricopeptide repeat protein [Desulfovibrionaceae bacterium]|nr:tetratricopeptide repeat protein [Desulfovibrionaceae bacterium]
MDIDAFFQGLDAGYKSGDRELIAAHLLHSLNQADAEKDFNAAVTILNEMMGFYRKISDHAASIKAGDQAIAILRSLGYENTVPFGTTLLNAATAHRAAGNTVRALEFFTGALGVFRHHLPEDDYRLAGVYNNVSSIYEELGNYDEAVENLELALTILEKQDGVPLDTATVMVNLAHVLLKINRQDEAVAILEKAMAVFQNTRTEATGPQYAAALAGMAEAYYRIGRIQDAVRAYESALAHLKTAVGENADYAFTLRNLAVAYEALGAAEKANELMHRAHQLLSALGMDTAPESVLPSEDSPLQ